MAKATVAIFTLIMLGVWGWMAWGEYAKSLEMGQLTGAPAPPDAMGFGKYVAGIAEESPAFVETDLATSARSQAQIVLGAIVALSATLFFAVTGGSGAIFGVMITAFVSFLAAAANMVFGLVFAGVVAWTAIGDGALDLSIGVYAVLLYCGVVIVASFAAMRQMPQLVRGRKEPMKGVMKSLLILMLASGGLGPFGVVPQFAIAGYSGFYYLAALCLLALAFVGMTHSNYTYD